MAERSKELIQVGYFLSRFGKTGPPSILNSRKWKEAYYGFYDELNGGRTVLGFEHSLKNSRDGFDGYFKETEREGWKSADGKPSKLTGISAKVYEEFTSKSEEEIWSIISNYFVPNADVHVFEDLIAEDMAGSDTDSTYTEGGERVVTRKTLERNSRLRKMALEIHGYECQVCKFNFQTTYGSWGEGFIEVHHIVPLSEWKGRQKQTDPKKDMAVLCSNCHRMVHRKKGTTLTLDELRMKLER